VRANFFLFDSERASGIVFNLRPPVKMVDFHCEAAFVSVFDGIRDKFLGVVPSATLFLTVQIYIDYCSNVIFTIQM
jgi:hypothetical protein